MWYKRKKRRTSRFCVFRFPSLLRDELGCKDITFFESTSGGGKSGGEYVLGYGFCNDIRRIFKKGGIQQPKQVNY
jgi:hypothetical protein